MGGMALGAAVVSRYGTQWRNLIKAYALAEAVIGVFAIGFHPLFVNFLSISYDTILPALPGATAISAYKWGAAGLLILPQTILLGMTLPAAQRRLDQKNSRRRRPGPGQPVFHQQHRRPRSLNHGTRQAGLSHPIFEAKSDVFRHSGSRAEQRAGPDKAGCLPTKCRRDRL